MHLDWFTGWVIAILFAGWNPIVLFILFCLITVGAFTTIILIDKLIKVSKKKLFKGKHES